MNEMTADNLDEMTIDQLTEIHGKVHDPVLDWHENVLQMIVANELDTKEQMALHCLAIDIFGLIFEREAKTDEADTDFLKMIQNTLVTGYFLRRSIADGSLVFDGKSEKSDEV